MKSSETPPVTIAKMLKIEDDSLPKLPLDFLKHLRVETREFGVLIFAVSTRTIRLIPTESDQVIKLIIEIGELTPHFLDELGRVLTAHKVDTLYSSGICFTADSCQYEGYIDQAEMKATSLDRLKSELMQIRGITSVKLSVLTSE